MVEFPDQPLPVTDQIQLLFPLIAPHDIQRCVKGSAPFLLQQERTVSTSQ